MTSVASGPLFLTTRVNVPRLRTATRGVEVALTIWTSEMRGAASAMSVWALAWLLFGLESFVDVTSALLTADARHRRLAGDVADGRVDRQHDHGARRHVRRSQTTFGESEEQVTTGVWPARS